MQGKSTLLKPFIMLTTALFIVPTYAGTANLMPGQHKLFTSVEGGYTWNSLNSASVRSVSLPRSTNGGTGRVAAGAVYHACDALSYSAEMGWGYYGSTEFNSGTYGVDNTGYIYGMDLLLGASYHYQQFEFFGKLGGLVENVRMQKKTDLSKFVAGGQITGTTDVTNTITTVLPEMKIGATYNVNDALGVSLAWMYAFGTTVNMNLAPSYVANNIILNSSVTSPPVSLSSLTLGLVYNFA